MKARKKRLLLVTVSLSLLGLATFFILNAFQKNLVFFFTPTQISAGEAPLQHSFRVGGMVENGSLKTLEDGITVRFLVTDTRNSLAVQYRGILPDLFKEGKGVVAQGKLAQAGVFIAEQVLAKHDENYMPPDAKYAIDQAKTKAKTLPEAVLP
ncbi:cytochrome c maturation protein CcmE [Undibacterium pigrum]|uniref:Cytochrome c-type biogenesis protein CcmE n=1 Tax=Undibacterium pigrum TaxID=401470 RepID=A0A318JUA7_9BURK|nr:cytochrome c maturation protein CcmE [Undibacterium pigrum]PXX44068.1 cytochrome c-type biogenesis protein CcmE [Undibacterium pigrum]